MARMSILFDGFNDLAHEIDKVGGERYLKSAVNDALTKTQQLVQDNVQAAAAPYANKGLKGYAQGNMYKSIVNDGQVEWTGNVATVRVGFNLHEKGGFHSIFVMYGTPKMSKDQKVFNAIKGTKTRKDIEQLQQEVMTQYLKVGK